MCFNNLPTVNSVSPYSTIVGPLGSREPIFRPTKWVQILVKESVLLFNAKPRMFVFRLFHHFGATLAVIGFSGFFVIFVRFTKY